MAYAAAGLGGVVFFVMSVLLLGVWPARVLDDQIAATTPDSPLGLSAAEARGRATYAREGCAYCHTQQIRYAEADVARFGAPTLAWETRFDLPHLWGTRRIGPDLARAGGTRPADWQFVHLYSPRAVAPLSIMPAYPWLFDGAPDRPRQEARDLVAYLETLGRAREIAWPEGDARAGAALSGDRWARMSFDAPVLNAHPARTRPRGGAPVLAEVPTSDRGRELWVDYCAACHGNEGTGDGPGSPWLDPRPTDLTVREYTLGRLADVLWNGVDGTAMPAFRDHAPDDLAALAAVVRDLSVVEPEAPPSPDDLVLGEQVYQDHCAQCHGPVGGGDGFAADELTIAPTDFQGQRVSRAEALRVLREGISGTPMAAAWTDRLDETELAAVAGFVRELFAGQGGGADQ
jgi:mono/diheme cytochrome c family protein